MADSVDSLNIVLSANANQASKAIDVLITKIDNLSRSMTGLNASSLVGLSNGVQRLAGAMASIHAVGTADFTRLAKNLEKMGSVQTKGIDTTTSAMYRLSKALTSLGGNTGAISGVSAMAQAVSKFGSKTGTAAIDNIPKLTTALNNLIYTLSKAPTVSNNTINLANALANLASQGSKVKSASVALKTNYGMASNSAEKATRSYKGFASAIGSFYAKMWVAIRGVKQLATEVKSTADYIESYNYFNVAFGKIGSDWSDQYEKYGYDSAEAYAESFQKRMSESLKSLSGLSVEIGADGKGLLTESGMKNLGLNIQEVTQYASQLASVTNSLGQTGETSLAMSKSFTRLAGDISSLFNVDYSTVSKNLQSGLIGQSRALYKYGIDITNATLQTYAYNLGIEKSVSDMTQAEKQQLRFIAILDQSCVSWSDLANTIQSPANMMRMFTNNMKEAGLVLGQLFMPALQKVLPVLNGMSIAIKRLLVDIAGIFNIELDLDAFGKGYQAIEDTEDYADDAADSYDNAAKAAEEWKNQLLGFDEINRLSDQDTSDSGAGTETPASTFDLTDEITKAADEYEKVWQTAYDKMDSSAQKWADNFEKYLKPIKSAIKSMANDDFYGAGKTIAGAINSGLNAEKWEDAGASVAQKITDGLKLITGFTGNLDWKKFARSLTGFVNGGLRNIKGEDFADVINAILNGAWDFVTTFIKTLDWKQIPRIIGETLADLDWDTVTKIGMTIIGAKLVGGIIKSFGTSFVNSFKAQIKSSFTSSAIMTTASTSGTSIASALIGGLTSPTAWAGFGISAIIAGFLIKAIDDTEKYNQKLEDDFYEMTRSRVTAETRALCDAINDMAKESIEQADKSFEDFKTSIEDMQIDTGTIEDLAGKYFDLAEKQNKSNEELQNMQLYHDLLISNYPDLEKILDDETQSYKDQRQAVDDYIESIKNKAMAEAAMEALKDEYKGLFAAQKKANAAEGTYLDLRKKWFSASKAYTQAHLKTIELEKERTKALEYGTEAEFYAADAAYSRAKSEEEAAWESYKATEDSYFAIKGVYDTATEKAQEYQDNIDYLSGMYSDAMGNMSTAAQDMADAQSEAYDQVSSDAKDSYDKVEQASRDCVNSVVAILNSGGYWQAGNNASINVSNGLRSGITLVGSAAAALTEAIKTNLPTNVYQTKGRDMITELNNGLNNSSSLNVVFATAKSIGDKINELLGYGKKTITVDIQQTPMQWAGANTTGIRAYATGGFPEDGLFFANHDELVGRFSNGKTAVANNEQITAGIEQAAYRGMAMALSQYGGGSASVNVVLEGDADGLFKAVQGKANNYTRQTGKPAFMT
ncbi:MAG: hypothetical protein ACI4EU_03035 [Butyrivibrio sp.]